MTIDITPEMRERAIELLTPELEAITQRMRELAIELLTPELEAITQRMRELASEVAAEFEMSEQIASLWLTELTRQGMSAVRDREAGRAEWGGCRQTVLAEALGIGDRSNYRRTCKNAKEFAETQRVADRTGMTLPVMAGDWTFEVTPQGS